MSAAHRFSALSLCLALVWMTGCVGPAACGPHDQNGPVVWGAPCGGCGECEGCGELYIDPWINHPPDCCDPCDQCGNYNGQSCGKCRSIFDGFASLWGYRCEPPCDHCGAASCDGLCQSHGCDDQCTGCDSCHGGPGYVDSGQQGIVIGNDVVKITAQPPTPAKRIVNAAPTQKTFVPERQRRIFRRRPNVAEGTSTAAEYK